MYVSPNHSVYLHVLNRMSFRYFYIPGLYLLAFGSSTCAIATRISQGQGHPGWGIWLSNHLVFFLIGFVLHSTLLFFVGWYLLKDCRFADPHEMKPDWDDTGKDIERRLRSVMKTFPWDYAHVPGMAMFVLSFALIAYAMNLHQTELDATDWGTAISLRFYLVFAIVLNVAGTAMCAGWYLFRGLEVDGATGLQQEQALGSSNQESSAKDRCLLSSKK